MTSRLILREIHTFEALFRHSDPNKKKPSLDDLTDQVIDQWCQKPFTHLWAMGVWERSPQSKKIALKHPHLLEEFKKALPDWSEKDVQGSPYSIFSYEIARLLGGKRAFQRFRKRLADKGIGLILDFVPNHLATDHPWIFQYPQRFVMLKDLDENQLSLSDWFKVESSIGKTWIAHGKDPYFPSWTDTAQLDYRKPETRKEMIKQLMQIAEYCDGVRCDMAMLLLNDVFQKTWGKNENSEIANEFWSEAIDTVHQKKPSFLFIAETYWGLENKLIELGFDYVYDKEFMTNVIQRNCDELRRTLWDKRIWGQRFIRFLENHDEQRIASQIPKSTLEIATALLWMQPSSVLWHDGQENAYQIKLPIQLTRRQKEKTDEEIVKKIKNILDIVADIPHQCATKTILRVNAVSEMDHSYQSILAILWYYEKRIILWIGNLSRETAVARIPLRLPKIADRKVHLNDLRTGETFIREGDELNSIGLFVRLGAEDFHWFDVKVIPNT